MTEFRVERDEASAEFFDAAARGTLLIRRCPVCGTQWAPARTRCPAGHALEWTEASGRAVLVTWAVEHEAPLDPALATPSGDTSAFGYVELDEGPWLQVPIVGVDPASLRAGISMQVCFIRPGDGEALPAFTPT